MAIRTAHILVHSVRMGDATSQHTFELARALQQMGYDVGIYCNYSSVIASLPPDIAPLVEQVEYATYQPTADLTILQYAIWFPLAERLREAAGKVLFWYHGVTPPSLWGQVVGRDRLVNAQLRTELAWHANLSVTCSPFTAVELAENSHLPPTRIRVVPIGVDLARFQVVPPPETLASLRAQWQLEGKRLLLCVGRVAGNKRLDLVMEAFSELLPSFPNLHLLIVGDDRRSAPAQHLAAQLRQHARILGIAEQVTFTGPVPQVEPYLHLADIYILASQHEGFGVPLVEAMAAGTPVVASRSGAAPWVLAAVTDTETDTETRTESGTGTAEPAGMLFAPGDVDDFTRQMARLLNNPTLAQMLVARGQARIHTFSLAAFAEHVQQVVAEATTLPKLDPSAVGMGDSTLLRAADVALRDYRVRSRLPLIGPLIAWLRGHGTSHLREPYLDRIMEYQVNFNRQTARTLAELEEEIAALQAEVKVLERRGAYAARKRSR